MAAWQVASRRAHRIHFHSNGCPAAIPVWAGALTLRCIAAPYPTLSRHIPTIPSHCRSDSERGNGIGWERGGGEWGGQPTKAAPKSHRRTKHCQRQVGFRMGTSPPCSTCDTIGVPDCSNSYRSWEAGRTCGKSPVRDPRVQPPKRAKSHSQLTKSIDLLSADGFFCLFVLLSTRS